MITTLVLDGGDQVLYSGDNFGFIHCWNVSDYGLNQKETKPPERKRQSAECVSYDLNHIKIFLGASLLGCFK